MFSMADVDVLTRDYIVCLTNEGVDDYYTKGLGEWGVDPPALRPSRLRSEPFVRGHRHFSQQATELDMCRSSLCAGKASLKGLRNVCDCTPFVPN